MADRLEPRVPTTRTAPSGAGQDAGNSYGSAPSAFSEGALLAPLPGPKSLDDTDRSLPLESGQDPYQPGQPFSDSVG